MKEITINGDVYVPKSELKNNIMKLPIGDKSNPYMKIGKNYFIRTVTHYFTGRLLWVGEKEITMDKVAWVVDTGRYSEFLKGKVVSEVEPYPDQPVMIGRGSIIDMTEWTVELLLSVK